MTNLILLAYGSEKEYQMAAVVVLSFWAWYGRNNNDARFLIYTDNPQYFSEILEGTATEYRTVTPEKWEAMLNGYTFKFHRKMAIIDETFEIYPNNNVIFLDSDVFFYSDPTRMLNGISDKISYMHIRELTLDQQMTFIPAEDRRRYIKHLESNGILVGSKKQQVTKNSYIWNAGVVGISPTMAPYVADVRLITEDIWQLSAVHISEQLAHTFVLGTLTKLKPSDQYIVHYWKKKDLIESAFAPLFEPQFKASSLPDRLDAVKTITQNYGRNFDLICHKEEALLAMKNRNLDVGIKATVKAVMQMLAGKGSWNENRTFLKTMYSSFN